MNPSRKSVLFVCVENSNRSQMAEAFARMHGGDQVDAARDRAPAAPPTECAILHLRTVSPIKPVIR